MKDIKQYLTEGFKLNKNYKKPYSYHPKDKEELDKLIWRLVREHGNNVDLNDIDISQIKDMSNLFENSVFNGDISRWDVSNVEDMEGMFFLCRFDGDLSKWDVSNVTNMNYMFAQSKFTGKNGDLSKWNINKNCKTEAMFYKSPLEGKEPEWYEK